MHAIKRVSSFTMLGVIINDRISADEHVTNTIATCSKSLHALRVLRAHGMANSSTPQRIQSNCSVQIALWQPSLVLLLQCSCQNRIDSFISHSKRSGYCADDVPPVAELFADSDNSLFEMSVEQWKSYAARKCYLRSTSINTIWGSVYIIINFPVRETYSSSRTSSIEHCIIENINQAICLNFSFLLWTQSHLQFHCNNVQYVCLFVCCFPAHQHLLGH